MLNCMPQRSLLVSSRGARLCLFRAMASLPYHSTGPGPAVIQGAEDHKAVAPAADRNKGFILDTLKGYIPVNSQGLHILETSSGTGQHCAHFAAAFPGVTFYPSDFTTDMFKSIAAYAVGLDNVHLPPLSVDARDAEWPSLPPLDGIITINMTHIAPWSASLGLLAGAGKYLKPGGRLFLYGPFKRDGQHTTESNAEFDASLQARNPEWGYRDVSDITLEAAKHQLTREALHEMPANNFMMVFIKTPASST